MDQRDLGNIALPVQKQTPRGLSGLQSFPKSDWQQATHAAGKCKILGSRSLAEAVPSIVPEAERHNDSFPEWCANSQQRSQNEAGFGSVKCVPDRGCAESHHRVDLQPAKEDSVPNTAFLISSC